MSIYEEVWCWEAFWGGLLGGAAPIIFLLVALFVWGGSGSDHFESSASYDADIGKRLSPSETEKYRCPSGTILFVLSPYALGAAGQQPLGNPNDVACLVIQHAEVK